MKKILLSLALAATIFSAHATDYTDQLTVAVNGVASPVQTTTISVDDNGNGTYNMSLKNFSFSGLNIGDITLNNVPGVNQDGIVYLAATDPVHVNIGGIMPLDLTVTLRGELRDNKSRLYATMDIPVAVLNQTVEVAFGRGYQLPNSGFEDYQDYNVSLVDMTTYTPTATTVQEPVYWHSFASAKGEYKDAAVAFANPFTWKSSVVRSGAQGASSLMLTSSNVMGIQIANGTVTTGRMNCGSYTATDPANHAEMEISNDSLDAHGDPYYVLLNGQPDSLTLWYAFKQGTPQAEHPYATVNAIITDGTYYQDPEDKAYTNKRAQAQNKTMATTFTDGTPVWKRISVPFSVIDKNVEAKAILVTISTNADPGAGSIDTLYVDDVNLVYNDPQNVNVTFGGNGSTVSADDITVSWDGALGARVVKDLRQDGDNVVATVTVYNGDLTKEIAKESHTYTNATVTGIDHVATASAAKTAATYDLSGRRVDNAARGGVFIVRTTDGKTVKVVRR
ncbi:calycin-like domain-containing protein [uncultured Prevotella sp.]|uniref:calycin-like domain-containing protein n=1 Tax=uncultured Prevotella sp. TaxID=159272 RepID=UPI0025909CEE|nr:calycin-like domain-containing protein [uncultured Prevotella sp.]